MASLFILNAFSLSMISAPASVEVREITPGTAREIIADAGHTVSGVGHADTARIMSGILGLEIPVNRVSVSLTEADCAIIAQYSGPRLPEGATELPEGAELKWMQVYSRPAYIYDVTGESLGVSYKDISEQEVYAIIRAKKHSPMSITSTSWRDGIISIKTGVVSSEFFRGGLPPDAVRIAAALQS